jgi:2-C-methyl-D-erythritol 4-phosphate cytidylyltransferase
LDRPKALATVAGKPMLEWSVEALRALDAVEQIVVALPAESIGAAPPGPVGTAGGDVRSESVRNALRACGRGDPVIVHDAARPFATTELFERALTELVRSGADAVVAAAPVSDTVKEVDDQTVTRTLDRGRLWAVQTPQVFRRDAIVAALESASDELLRAATDDAWLIERAGGTVRVVRSDPGNLKVTTAADLHIAEMLLRERAG